MKKEDKIGNLKKFLERPANQSLIDYETYNEFNGKCGFCFVPVQDKVRCGMCKINYCSEHMRKIRKTKNKQIRVCDNCQDKTLYDTLMKQQLQAQQALSTQQQILKLKFQQISENLKASTQKFGCELQKNIELKQELDQISAQSEKRTKDLQDVVKSIQKDIQNTEQQISRINNKYEQLEKNESFLILSINQQQQKLTQLQQKISSIIFETAQSQSELKQLNQQFVFTKNQLIQKRKQQAQRSKLQQEQNKLKEQQKAQQQQKLLQQKRKQQQRLVEQKQIQHQKQIERIKSQYQIKLNEERQAIKQKQLDEENRRRFKDQQKQKQQTVLKQQIKSNELQQTLNNQQQKLQQFQSSNHQQQSQQNNNQITKDQHNQNQQSKSETKQQLKDVIIQQISKLQVDVKSYASLSIKDNTNNEDFSKSQSMTSENKASFISNKSGQKPINTKYSKQHYDKLKRIDENIPYYSIYNLIELNKKHYQTFLKYQNKKQYHSRFEVAKQMLREKRRQQTMNKPTVVSMLEQKVKYQNLMNELSEQFQSQKQQQLQFRQMQQREYPSNFQQDYNILLIQKKKIQKQISHLQKQSDVVEQAIKKKQSMLQDQYIEWETRQRNKIMNMSFIKKESSCLMF